MRVQQQKLLIHSSRHGSQVLLLRGERVANGKSIMGVMMLGANKGTEIELIISGDDEIETMVDLENLINNRFGEPE